MRAQRVGLGFDLRVDPGLQPENRSQDDQYLVPGVGPISADPSVWIGTEAIEGLMQEELPDFTGPLHLASSIDVLVENCRRRGIPTVGLFPVCITCSEASAMALRERYGFRWFTDQPTEEELLSRGWRLEGFDVVDLNGMISGLKGCGYRAESRNRLRHYFGSFMGRTGLFSDSGSAAQFAEVRGLQIRQHAPFVVVGVLVHGSHL
jgi:hypothetical protein